jgi:hypothetical protein
MADIADILGQGFDTSSVEPAEAFDIIPAGWYPAQIEAAEVKATKNGKGSFLALELSILGDKCANRKLWPKINLQNANPKCVEIGMRELAALGVACGLATIGDSKELLGKVVQAKVVVKAEEKDASGRVLFEAQNDVATYKPLDGAAPTAPAPQTAAEKPVPTAPKTAPATAAPATKGKRPWDR